MKFQQHNQDIKAPFERRGTRKDDIGTSIFTDFWGKFFPSRVIFRSPVYCHSFAVRQTVYRRSPSLIGYLTVIASRSHETRSKNKSQATWEKVDSMSCSVGYKGSYYNGLAYSDLLKRLSPGQTDSQVVASWKLGSTCDSVWPGLACTCVYLRSLWSRSNLHASQCKFFTVFSLASPFDQGFRETFFNFAKPFLKGSKVINVGEDVSDDGTFLR